MRSAPGARQWRRLARHGHGALLVLAAAYSLFPVYFITVQSLKTAQEDVAGSPLWVRAPSFENYTELFQGGHAAVRGYVVVPSVPFLYWLLNSLLVLLGTTCVTLVVAVLAAYAIGRLRPPGWRASRRVLLATYVIPQTILFIPLFRLVGALGLHDSLAALVVLYSAMALPFCTWILSAYYRVLPREIEESALVEGATPVRAFVAIVLPMSRNVLVAAGLFALGTAANDFMLASLFLVDPLKQTVAAGLGVMDVSLEELTTVAGANLAAVPLVIVCAVFARQYVRGLTAAMVEGA